MVLILAKIIADTVAIFAVAKTAHDFRRRKESLIMFLFWFFVWWGVFILTLFPQIIDKVFGAGRSGVNTFIGLVIVFVMYLTYRIYLKADRTERMLQRLIKEMAVRLPEE